MHQHNRHVQNKQGLLIIERYPQQKMAFLGGGDWDILKQTSSVSEADKIQLSNVPYKVSIQTHG